MMTKPERAEGIAQAVADTIESYFLSHPNVAVKKAGATLFTMSTVEYRLHVQHDRCSLFFWSEHFNMRRTVVKADERKDRLHLTLSRLGTIKKEVLWLTPSESGENGSEHDRTRVRYSESLSKALEIENPYPLCTSAIRKRTNLILPHIKGPYVLGVCKWNMQKWAFIAVGSHEKHESIICVLRAGIAWLAKHRAHSRFKIQGLRVICPLGYEEHLGSRIAWLSEPSQYNLYSFDDVEQKLVRVACERDKSCRPEIGRSFNQQRVLNRSMGCVAKLLTLLPPGAAYRIELQPVSFSNVSVRLDGLHFASIRYGPLGESLRLVSKLYYRVGRKDVVLEGEKSERLFSSKMLVLFSERGAQGLRTSPYYRSSTDAWLVKRIREVLVDIEPDVDNSCIYCNVEGSSHGRKDSIDILAASKKGRLMIVHVSADAARMFPMHGLDQWVRIRELHKTGALKKAGYFPGITLSTEDPCLLFVAPALRLESESEAVLRTFSKALEWKFIAISEHWRTSTRVIYRKDAAESYTKYLLHGFSSR